MFENMSMSMQLSGKRITVAGLGRFGGGIAVARWLVGQGARVLVTDQATADELGDSVRKLDGLPIEFRLGDQLESDFTSADLVVASPAIPLSNPLLFAARQAGVPITTEIRLFVERCPAKIVGVTGTKGKSTTSTLLGKMLATRHKIHVGGNIGGSLLDKLPEISPTDVVVLELSSYMLEHLKVMNWSPHVAVVTMVAADHIEWHGSLAAYQDAKKNIVRFQQPDDFAVLNATDPGAAALADETKARVVLYGVGEMKPFEFALPGAHNQLNAQGAFAAAKLLGVTWDDAQAAIAEFVGLPHRLQIVHIENGVRYVNDSIATIPEAAVAALESFPAKTVLQIVGGYDTHAPFTALCNALVERAKAVLCIGQTGPKIAEILAESTSQHAPAVYECHDLATAVKTAKRVATAGDVVLLSTGCKSYGQFTNFEQRGDKFTEYARSDG
jgi:UDP-N-acetylmuramoylalanine--D-glutamate ligase